MIYLFYIACIILYLVHPCDLSMGVSTTHLWGAFSYPLMHASLLHLAINMLALGLMYEPIFKIYSERFNFSSKFIFFSVMYLCAAFSGVLAAKVEPTIGASGMVYFLLGALIALRPTIQQLKSYIFVVLAFIISIIMDNSNALLHGIAFILGALYIVCLIVYDYRRLKNSR